jgi:DNA mismatch repair protein MutS2
MGHERAQALEPLADLQAVRQSLIETRQARQALAVAGPPPWNVIPDVRSLLEHARVPGSVAEPGELAGLPPLLEAAARLGGYGRSISAEAPGLARALSGLPTLAPLADLLRRSLDAEGGVRDEASSTLKRLRQKGRELRAQVIKRLESYFQGPAAEHIFQERYVTVRHGRYVLPIRSEAKARFKGIVHDRSQSGATLFVEPEGVVEANNDLVQVAREEEAEILRVLAALTDAVREKLPDLERLVEDLGRLDCIFARGELADRMEATEPSVTDGHEALAPGARNPLLLAQQWEAPERPVVPMDIEVGDPKPLLVITGPNAGGKTVALKTLGLLCLMAQSGLHVPAREGARLPLLHAIFAIIGDDQSVAENLSTFSAFVKQLREVLEQVDDRSLVLLDELGAFTDPDEGAALAQAVLEALAERGALCVASTHLEPLKGFASSHPKARNASVEFDAERLAPTFRLVYDRPGQSYALQIGARLGLPSELITRAESHRSTQRRQLEALLQRLEERDRQEAAREAQLERREVESATRLARAESQLEAARRQAAELSARTKSEAQRMLTEVRRAVNAEWDKLKKETRTREGLEQSRKRLVETARGLERTVEPEPPGTRPATAGDRVEVPHLGLKGDVLDVDGGTATVQAGAVTIKVPAQALRVVGRSEVGGTTPHPALSPEGRGIQGKGAPASSPEGRGMQRKGGSASFPEGRGTQRRGASASNPLPHRGRGQGEGAGSRTIPPEIHLIGRTTDEARDLLEKYLDDAFLAGLAQVRIIHGKGTGALRRAVEELLVSHPLVTSHRTGESHEGGAGATVAILGQS